MVRLMKKLIWPLIAISLSLMLLSCGGGSSSAPVAAATGWVIGQSSDKNYVPTAKILKTGDGGASWTLQTLPAGSIGFDGNDISAVNSQVAWAALGDLY